MNKSNLRIFYGKEVLLVLDGRGHLTNPVCNCSLIASGKVSAEQNPRYSESDLFFDNIKYHNHYDDSLSKKTLGPTVINLEYLISMSEASL